MAGMNPAIYPFGGETQQGRPLSRAPINDTVPMT